MREERDNLASEEMISLNYLVSLYFLREMILAEE